MVLRLNNFYSRTLPIAVALLITIAGCSDIPGYDSVVNFVSPSSKSGGEIVADKAAADPIQFRVGDRYTFDNPIERWEVVEIKGERVYWRNESGERRVTGFNPLLPPTEWQSRTNGSGRRLIRDVEGALFPIKVGATIRYRATVTSDRPPFGWEDRWSCSVESEKKIDTISGPFNAFAVLCGRTQKDEVTYYFAPKIGNYVMSRTKQAGGRPDRVRNLLSFERADGTVVAGIVQNSTPAADKPRAKATPKRQVDLTLAPAGRTVAAVNPPQTSDREEIEQDVLASVVLATPSFGGRAVPVRPQRPVSSTQARNKKRDVGEPPKPEPAPLAKVSRAAPPPPVAQPASKPVRSVRAPASPAPQVLGPRATGRALPIKPRARVPVPPPPAIKSAVPPPPKPIARAVPASPRPRIPVPPPPVVKPAVPLAAKSQRRSVPPVPSIPPPPTPVASTMTIHLASFRSEAAAQQGWTALASANGDLLKGLKPEIREVTVEGKGTYFRLHAMPVPLSAVGDLCQKLNRRGVFCTPAG